MKNYRLKPEAVPYFKEKYATSIGDFDFWDKQNVDFKALEEVEEAYITYGHKSFDKNSTSLSGWSGDGLGSSDKGSHFHFTLNFPSIKFEEHDRFTNGKMMRELMNDIQIKVNLFYRDFNKGSNDEH